MGFNLSVVVILLVYFFPCCTRFEAPQGTFIWKYARRKANNMTFRTTNTYLLEKCIFLPTPSEQGQMYLQLSTNLFVVSGRPASNTAHLLCLAKYDDCSLLISTHSLVLSIVLLLTHQTTHALTFLFMAYLLSCYSSRYCFHFLTLSSKHLQQKRDT